MIDGLLIKIGIKRIRKEGSELLCECPDCNTNHLYINPDSGLWDCKKGCDSGNLFELVKKLTGFKAKECFEILEEFGFAKRIGQNPKPKPKDISWFSNRLKKATEKDLSKLCEIKRISFDALSKFEPKIHTAASVMAIPAYDPLAVKVCGYLRVGLNGEPVKLKNGRSEKYPAIGSHGIYALGWIRDVSPKRILFCEAWRDALAAIEAGYCATASSGGASTFKDCWLEIFKGKEVYICMDADAPGQKAAKRAAKRISSVAKAVFIIGLPYEIKEKHGKDLHDYLVIEKGDMAELICKAVRYTDNNAEFSFVLSNDDPDTVAEKINEYCRIHLDEIYRYNSIDGWSVYRAGKYERIDDIKELDILIRRCLRKCVVEAREQDDDGNIEIKHRPLKRKNHRFVGDVREFWATLEGVYIEPGLKATSSLDGSLDPMYVLPLKNGLLDFSKYPYKLLENTPEFYTFNYLDFDWEGEQDSELWVEFLFTITCGDEEMFLLLQQWAGYLLKRSCEHQKFLLCYGEGANGKSVFFDVMTALLGVCNCSAVPLSKFDDIHYLTQTYGKFANITDESSKGLEEDTETALKQFTGGTQIIFKRLYHQSFSAYPTAKIMIATNKLPRFLDTSNGIWRRMLLVPFKAVIAEKDQDRELAKKIKDSQMSGVLKWALEGLRALEEDGRFVEPSSCSEAVEEYKREVNPLVVFLEENFEQSKFEYDKVECKHLRNCYSQWCEEHGYRPKNDTNVGVQIKKFWPQVEKRQIREGCDRKRYYCNLNIKADSEFAPIL